jgi:hypothetical protein
MWLTFAAGRSTIWSLRHSSVKRYTNARITKQAHGWGRDDSEIDNLSVLHYTPDVTVAPAECAAQDQPEGGLQ